MSIERVRNCGLYIPGHVVHWIQARKGAGDMKNLPTPGHLMEVRLDGLVINEWMTPISWRPGVEQRRTEA